MERKFLSSENVERDTPILPFFIDELKKLFDVAYSSLKFSDFSEEWNQFLDDSTEKLLKFLQTPSSRTLFISHSDKKYFSATLSFPHSAEAGSKIFYVSKLPHIINITSKDFKGHFVSGELFKGEVLENVSKIIRLVFVPAVLGSHDHHFWPSILKKDLFSSIFSFLAELEIIQGNRKGNTILPYIPLVFLQDHFDPKDENLLFFLKSYITLWEEEIEQVFPQHVSSKISTLRKSDWKLQDSLPQIDIWEERAYQLKNIKNQLKSNEIELIGTMLESCSKEISEMFVKLVKKVDILLELATKNAKLFYLLKKYVKIMKNEDCSKLDNLFTPIFHIMGLIYNYSGSHNSTLQFPAILREISDLLIYKAVNYVDDKEIFNYDLKLKKNEIKNNFIKLTII